MHDSPPSDTERPDAGESQTGPGLPTVTIVPLSDGAVEALTRPMIVARYFPFIIGRQSFRDPTFRHQLDLSFHDPRPHRLSKRHIQLVVEAGDVLAVDTDSQRGSRVNGESLGRRAGGAHAIALRPGDNEVVLGGDRSRYRFTFTVGRSDRVCRSGGEMAILGRFHLPVSALYEKMCDHASAMLTRQTLGPRRRVEMAQSMAVALADHPGAVARLYHYAAHPGRYPDVIVAHSVNVAVYAVKLAHDHALPRTVTLKLATAALLHDIGLYELPPMIIYTKTPLSEGELRLFRKHTLAGFRLLGEDNGGDPETAVMVRDHHERIDGSGYPSGTQSLSALTELFAAVDFLESITHHRPQRGAVTPHEGMRRLTSGRDGSFSAGTLSTLLNSFSFYPVFSVVRLDSGEVGQVVRTHRDWPLKPVVRILFDAVGAPVTTRREINLLTDDRHIIREISDRSFIDGYFKKG